MYDVCVCFYVRYSSSKFIIAIIWTDCGSIAAHLQHFCEWNIKINVLVSASVLYYYYYKNFIIIIIIIIWSAEIEDIAVHVNWPMHAKCRGTEAHIDSIKYANWLHDCTFVWYKRYYIFNNNDDNLLDRCYSFFSIDSRGAISAAARLC